MRWVAIVLAVVLVAASCGDDDDEANTSTTTTEAAATDLTSPTEPLETTATGTINLSVQDWAGVSGYRLLAGVRTGGDAGEIVGGAFWTIIDSDPFSGEDVVHPAYHGDVEPEGAETWAEGDYLWDETALLEPGTYVIDFWANPGELAPYGSHLPAEPIERRCWVEVRVEAGEASTVILSEIPAPATSSGAPEFERCPMVDS